MIFFPQHFLLTHRHKEEQLLQEKSILLPLLHLFDARAEQSLELKINTSPYYTDTAEDVEATGIYREEKC